MSHQQQPSWSPYQYAMQQPAQRAFRQRKEEYIKSLKDQVKEFESLADNYKALQAENYQLRDYIINLQSRLLEMHGDVPPPPANIDLSRPSPHSIAPTSAPPGPPGEAQSPRPHQSSAVSLQAPTAAMTSAAVTQLQQAAAQAAAQQASANSDLKHPIQEDGYLPASADYPAKRPKPDDVGGNPSHSRPVWSSILQS